MRMTDRANGSDVNPKGWKGARMRHRKLKFPAFFSGVLTGNDVTCRAKKWIEKKMKKYERKVRENALFYNFIYSENK